MLRWTISERLHELLSSKSEEKKEMRNVLRERILEWIENLLFFADDTVMLREDLEPESPLKFGPGSTRNVPPFADDCIVYVSPPDSHQ